MKRILFSSILFITSVLVASSQNASVKAGKLLLDRALLSKDWDMSIIFDKLGRDHRISDKTNKVYTYDKLGIVAFEQKKNDEATGQLLEIQFHFNKTDENNIVPSSYFTGNLKIEKLNVTAGTSVTEVDNKLSKYQKESAYSAHNYRYAYKGLYIYFLFNENETGLKKISIGPDRR